MRFFTCADDPGDADRLLIFELIDVTFPWAWLTWSWSDCSKSFCSVSIWLARSWRNTLATALARLTAAALVLALTLICRTRSVTTVTVVALAKLATLLGFSWIPSLDMAISATVRLCAMA